MTRRYTPAKVQWADTAEVHMKLSDQGDWVRAEEYDRLAEAARLLIAEHERLDSDVGRPNSLRTDVQRLRWALGE